MFRGVSWRQGQVRSNGLVVARSLGESLLALRVCSGDERTRAESTPIKVKIHVERSDSKAHREAHYYTLVRPRYEALVLLPQQVPS